MTNRHFIQDLADEAAERFTSEGFKNYFTDVFACESSAGEEFEVTINIRKKDALTPEALASKLRQEVIEARRLFEIGETIDLHVSDWWWFEVNQFLRDT